MKKRISSEYQECLAFFKWAQYHEITRNYLLKIPNEGKRNAFTGYCLKIIGLRAGVPDYFLAYPNDKYHGLWLEMKVDKSSNIPQSQKDWIAKLNKVGHYAIVVYGAQHAIEITTKYLNNLI